MADFLPSRHALAEDLDRRDAFEQVELHADA